MLSREKFRSYLTIDEAEAYAAGLASLAETIPDAQQVERVARDPNDDYLIALALAVDADALVSGDSDLLDLELRELRILSPRQALDLLGRESGS